MVRRRGSGFLEACYGMGVTWPFPKHVGHMAMLLPRFEPDESYEQISVLPHQLLDRRRLADEMDRPALRRHIDLAGVDAELRVNRRGEVFRVEDALDGGVAFA